MKREGYLTSLSSLRGIAALLVILFHINVICFSLADYNGYFSHFIRKGYLWVDFFFLLSGFIMMHVYGELFSGKVQKHHYKKFIQARFARIYPLHIFSFLVMIAYYFWYRANFTLNAADGLTFNMQAIPTTLLLMQSLDIHHYLSWDSAAWSISTEWWMYVIFPFLLIPFRKISDWKRIFIFLSIIAGYLGVIYFLHPLSTAASPFPDPNMKNTLDVTYDYGFVRCFLGFVFGMLIYELYRVGWGEKHLKHSGILFFFMAAIVILLSIQIPDYVPVLFFGALVLISVYTEGIGRKLLGLGPLVFLGDISYSLYLMHLPIMFFLMSYLKKFPGLVLNPDFTHAWFYAGLYLVVVIIASALTYNFIEVPLRQKINSRTKV